MPSIRSHPSLEETQSVARELFARFTREQLTESGVSETLVDQQLHHLRIIDDGFSLNNPLMSTVGRDLRRISEEFARSAERLQVRDRASRIEISRLTNEEFTLLLRELFHNGEITRERIVVLFFFCSDLALRALTNGPIMYFKRLIQWSLSFIMETICAWVYRQGGWEVVLGSYVPKFVMTACAIMGCIAFALYIKKNWI